MIIQINEMPQRCRRLCQDLMWRYGYAYGTISLNETHWRIVLWDDLKDEPNLCLNTELRILLKTKMSGAVSSDWVEPKKFVLTDDSSGGLFFGLLGEVETKALIRWDDGNVDLIDPDKILVIYEEWKTC